MKVAIVENEFITQLFITGIVESMGYEVVGCAANFDDAVILFKKENPDLLIVDIYLEGNKTGVDFVQNTVDSTKKVVFISGNLDERTLSKIEQTEFSTFLNKPFDKEDLQKEIRLCAEQTN